MGDTDVLRRHGGEWCDRSRRFGMPYRILFTIDGSTVNVLRILHAAQDRIESDDI